MSLYRPPKQSSSAITKFTPKHKKAHPNARWIGASILLFMIDPDNYVFFVLGQEASHPGYKDSNKWSDFGGGAKSSENEYICAAREFLEETNHSINPYPKKFGLCGVPSVYTISQELKNKQYTARFDYNFTDTTILKTYTTFLIEIPWDPTIGYHFAKKLHQKQKLYFTYPSYKYRNFQNRNWSKAASPFEEKSTVQLFSIPTILHSIATSLYKPESTKVHTPPLLASNEYNSSGYISNQYTFSEDSVNTEPVFRKFFLKRIMHILNLAFPRNVTLYQSLTSVPAFQRLQGVKSVVLPPPVSSSSGKWNRGVQIPMHISRDRKQQPPNRIFRNFNTHRRPKSQSETKTQLFL